MKTNKLVEKITFYNSYFDLNDNLSTKSILNIFQDVASLHAEDLGVGYLAMLEKNLYWVLIRIKLDILKMPEINQTVIVETWPHEKGKVDFDRDLKILSQSGETLVVATSKWCVIDAEKRTLQRTDNIDYNGKCCSDVIYKQGAQKIFLPKNEFVFKFDYIVQYSDIDHNKHMNNTNYANLVFNAVENKHFTHFEINFNNECVLNDKIQVYTVKDECFEYVVGKVEDKIAFVSKVGNTQQVW